MKILIAFLIIFLLALQYKLWLADDGLHEVWRLTEKVELHKHKISILQSRNQALTAEVADLKSGLGAIEERARSELGMIRRGEIFYYLIGEKTDGSAYTRHQNRRVDGN